MKSEYIVALDLGTSKIRAKAARKNGTELAYAELDADGCVRQGYVHNTEVAAEKIRQLIRDLNRQLTAKGETKIKQIYVGLGGFSFHSEYYVADRTVDGEVTDEILAELRQECEQYEPEAATVYGIIAPEYRADGKLEQSPKGVHCKELSAKFRLIVGRPQIQPCLKTTVEDKARLKVVEYIVSPLASAAELTPEEKRDGCALIETGAGITTLSIYKNNLLHYLATIPLAGDAITKDLSTVKDYERNAEEWKLQSADLLTTETDEIHRALDARVNEIFSNVFRQIKNAGFESDLPAGLIITGGSSQLKNLQGYLEKQKYPVRIVSYPTQSCLKGLLLAGKENCAEDAPEEPIRPVGELFGSPAPVSQEKPKPKQPTVEKNEKPERKGWLGTWIKNVATTAEKTLFDDQES